jgi:hypothetical protein
MRQAKFVRWLVVVQAPISCIAVGLEEGAGEVFKVKVPDGIKDANDWLKELGRDALLTGLAYARPMPATKPDGAMTQKPVQFGCILVLH